MRTHSVSGGWFADALPTGEYVAGIRGRGAETHLGLVPVTPEGDIRFPRLHDNGIRFAGQAQNGFYNWEWNGSAWERRSLSCGVNPVIYRAGGLVENTGCAAGTQGFRFVDEGGRIWSGDETYFDPVLSINEWSRLGPVTVGQDNQSPHSIIVYRGQRRVLATGGGRFIRLRQRGDQFAVAMWREGVGDAFFIWFSESEIETRFPLAPSPSPDPEPPPPPPPLPMTPDHSEIVRQLNVEIPELLHRNTIEDAARFTRFAALRLHAHDPAWGLLTKTPGEKNVDGFAIDAVIYKTTQQVVDIVSGAGDGPTPGRVSWGHQPKRPNNNWAQPIPVADNPPPPPPPPPPSCNCKPELEALRTRLAAAADDLQNLNERLMRLENLPVPEFELVPDKDAEPISTSRAWAHSHEIRLRVKRKF